MVHEVPPDAVPLFLREGARLVLRPEPGGETVALQAADTPAPAGDGWTATRGAGGGGDSCGGAPGADWMALWFGQGLHWTAPSAER
jgi:hypothetical protein